MSFYNIVYFSFSHLNLEHLNLYFMKTVCGWMIPGQNKTQGFSSSSISIFSNNRFNL